ncbi:metabolite traffic protein EboE [Catenovulum sp. 2E275]|uniref:metabolite traffic protein EboE n=1 Tax=Catenovulum sp. 2E275 TaxID=2980497 RepID=UPI0021D36D99|nr:metabolite traffic protein EboE [Catenovulum sp. 2E275]MCU4676153.1 metabolite traffic protein EboE [Catenovulum sp. 2E275]
MQPIFQWQKHQLAYCSNLHPGSELAQVNANIKNWFNPVMQKRQLTNMASGLWLASPVAQSLTDNNDLLADFNQLLNQQSVNLTSLNGFPFGNFHQKVVKQKVYLPTWAEPERLTYTKQLADILASQLSKNANVILNNQLTEIKTGAISTLPLAYAKNWTVQQHNQAIHQLIELAIFLKNLEANTQVRIQLGLEMEPDCVLENTQQLITFFTEDLLPAAMLQGLNKADILNYIGCCFDTCHQAVMHENIQQSLANIQAAGIQICKIQISNAISTELTSEQDVAELTALLKDEKFLHQCKLKAGEQYIALDDLTETQLLSAYQSLSASLNQAEPIICNVHYHVPIHLTALTLSNGKQINTTQPAILACLDYLKTQTQGKPYLEIETYSWLEYLTSQDKNQTQFDLISGLADEFNWLETELKKRQLLS